MDRISRHAAKKYTHTYIGEYVQMDQKYKIHDDDDVEAALADLHDGRME
jgi:ribosomal protein S17